jgi:hypothetical protein
MLFVDEAVIVACILHVLDSRTHRVKASRNLCRHFVEQANALERGLQQGCQ